MIVQNKKAVIRHFETKPKLVREYFYHLPDLVGKFPLDVTLAYIFAQVELAHNMTLYCGLVKLHKANAKLTRNVVDTHRMTRQYFRDRFSVVFGDSIPEKVVEPLEAAEKIRDRVMHGKATSEKDKRTAIVHVVDYAVSLNSLVSRRGGFQPFGPLRGFKGRGKSLDKGTTRWMLKGMGFDGIA